MRKSLTTAQMLSAARMRLEEHLATRPATTGEAAAIAAAHHAEAESLQGSASSINVSGIVDLGGSLGSCWGAATTALKTRMEIERLATAASMAAEGWERVAAGGDVAWHVTRAELEARVAFYRSLLARETAQD